MDALKKELQQLSKDPILSKKHRNKKLLVYLVRTLIAVTIIYFLWDYDWVKWVLYIYIPLNLISLISILGWNYFLNKRLAKTQK
ncbi:MAG: hypothetical protein HRU50_07500 [Winogradskyella sp.]|uniref:hypothetical protein n=1 Tax=Winogradskyella sp. TaxID=1883156 RepID=UPI0025CE7296|nr:hypothetical protein [Winogradskyella sp.]NRB59778.1 hypothetical protein [Winogradskyella sp.]